MRGRSPNSEAVICGGGYENEQAERYIGAGKSFRGAENCGSGRPPKELAGQAEERLLDAAREVFLERGFEGASIDEIAEAARSGKPTIYARFPNKPALFTAADRAS